VSLDAFDVLVRATLAGSAAILVVLLARRFLRRRFGALVAYVAWALVPAAIVAMLLPAPAHPVAALAGIVRVAPLQAAPAAVVVDAFDPRLALFVLWLTGALLAAAWFAQQQRRYLQSLGRLHARDGARLVQSDSEFAGPALVGAWRPRIVLPSDFDRRYDARERELILAHEQVHFVRGDAWVNALVVALRSLNWFNPLLHYAAAKFRIDQELACDAAVVARFPEARRQYADAMLKVQLAGQPRQELRLPVGCRWPSDKTLKERILMLKQSRPTRARCIAGLVLVALLGLGGTYAAWATQAPQKSSDAKAASTEWVVHLDIADAANGDVASWHTQLVEGQPKDFLYGKEGDRRRIVTTVTGIGDGMVDAKFQLYRRDKLASSPELHLRQGVAGQIKVGKDDGAASPFDGFDLHVTVERAPASADSKSVATREKEAKPDHDAEYARMSAPAYPGTALKDRVQGTVFVVVSVAADGSVADARVDHVQPETAAALGDAAVAAVKSWTFNPATSGGKAVAGDVIVPITFSLDGHGTGVTTPTHDGKQVLDALTVAPPEKH